MPATFNPYNGVTDEICKVYIARELVYVGGEPDETEEFEALALTPDETRREDCRPETIWDGMTIAAWGIVRARLDRGCSTVKLRKVLSFCVFLAAASAVWLPPAVKVGADVLLSNAARSAPREEGRSGHEPDRTHRSGEFLVDVLIARGVNVTALFGPEHGIRGEAGAGERGVGQQLTSKPESPCIPSTVRCGSRRPPC